MTLHELLVDIQSVVALGQGLPLGDPRITLALALLQTTLGVVQQVVATEGGDTPIAVEHLGEALAANLQAQLAELRRTN